MWTDNTRIAELSVVRPWVLLNDAASQPRTHSDTESSEVADYHMSDDRLIETELHFEQLAQQARLIRQYRQHQASHRQDADGG